MKISEISTETLEKIWFFRADLLNTGKSIARQSFRFLIKKKMFKPVPPVILKKRCILSISKNTQKAANKNDNRSRGVGLAKGSSFSTCKNFSDEGTCRSNRHLWRRSTQLD
ncbi:MAG: hypothetical protein V7L13_21950 [Nostoc sp.]|uniref:hypothetical protein n=1 Tax=Nostoc sp. TaxID=1180 RepID=UPI002FF4F3E1